MGFGVREPVGPGAGELLHEGFVHSLTCHKISGKETLGRHYYSHFTGKKCRSLHTARIDRVSAEPWGSRIAGRFFTTETLGNPRSFKRECERWT